MDRNRKRWILRLAAVLVAGIGVWIFVLWQSEQNRVTIENRSGQPIAELQITLNGQTTKLENVPPREIVPIPGSGDGTQVLRVKVVLQDGSMAAFSGAPKERERLYVLPGGTIEVHRPDREEKH